MEVKQAASWFLETFLTWLLLCMIGGVLYGVYYAYGWTGTLAAYAALTVWLVDQLWHSEDADEDEPAESTTARDHNGTRL